MVTLDQDEVWSWNLLSKIVAQINQSPTWRVQLLTPDGPAVQLCRQTNAGVGMPYELVVSEVAPISLLDPSLPAIAATSSGGLAYQVREHLQSIAERDHAHGAR